MILDPMAGSGTILIACSLGRNVIVLDLEQKFVDMMRGNWEKIKQRGPQMGYKMGEAVILQGDARNLERLLADKIMFSPPFSEQGADEAAKYFPRKHRGTIKPSEFMPGNIQNLPYGQIDKIITSPPYAASANVQQQERVKRGYFKKKDGKPASGFLGKMEVPERDDNIGNLSYGSIDAVISSPPYAETVGRDAKYYEKIDTANKKRALEMYGKQLPSYTANLRYSYTKENMDGSEGNIGNLKYGNIDAVITSPPYENVIAEGDAGPLAHASYDPDFKDKRQGYTSRVDAVITSPPYQAFGASREGEKIRTGKSKIHKEKSLPTTYTKEQTDNLGNLQGDTYLSAMKLVYEQCYKVLKPGGLMILVVKNFIRNKKEIDLKADTRRLCEQAGFEFIEEHHRLLTSQSFWRILYMRKYPNAPKIDKEYILVFKR